ncbi:hypothetical protein AX16_008189 [Volvariella volvacea WC 439]|nr:hypothetical protein AX16_008189 [Volvariella volvacea WC 439]
MPPRFRVLAGPSPDNLTPITTLVNTNQPHKITSDIFEGEIIANIKDFVGPDGFVRRSEYFERQERQGVTWSIQVQGRFLVPCSSDDILFGNTFDRPLHLPWGSSAALKFMQYVDPTLEHNLNSQTRPWALSPLISTMPYFSHSRVPSAHEDDNTSPIALVRGESPVPVLIVENSEGEITNPPDTPRAPGFPPAQSLMDNTSQIHLAMVEYDSHGSSGSSSSSKSDTASISSLSSVDSRSSRSSRTSLSFLSSGKGSALKLTDGNESSGSSGSGKLKNIMKKKKKPRVKAQAAYKGLNLTTASQRRSYFSDASRRQAVYFGPQDVITTDFCYGFLEFNPSLALKLPGGLTFDLMRYWDRQPVRFVCCQRKHKSSSSTSSLSGSHQKADGDGGEDVPWSRIFWCISIEIVEEDEESKPQV